MPSCAAYEEGAEAVEVLGGLFGLAHFLDYGGEGEQVRSEEADDEVVVVLVESVAGQADVRGESGDAVTAA
ncbi:MAG: hypothetical protein OXI74_11275, partial [Rhodospirillaceae bacterium]|nr:hypothetical protein [Rhodospirillaceae bacterium]